MNNLNKSSFCFLFSVLMDNMKHLLKLNKLVMKSQQVNLYIRLLMRSHDFTLNFLLVTVLYMIK